MALSWRVTMDYMTKLYLVALGAMFFSTHVFAKEWRCTNRTYANLPVVIPHCESEGCGDLVQFAMTDTPLYETRDTGSKIKDTLKQCEKLGDASTSERIDTFGTAKVIKLGRKLREPVQVGDTVVVVSRQSEGYASICVENEVIGVVLPGVTEPKPPSDYPSAEIIKPVSSSAWIEITTPRETSGFAPLTKNNPAFTHDPTSVQAKACDAAAKKTSPCNGIEHKITDEEKTRWAGPIAQQLRRELKDVKKVEVLRAFRSGRWKIIEVNTSVSDEPFLFYSSDPLRSKYIASWSGAASYNEEGQVTRWVLANAPGIPKALARCFGWYVSNGREW